MVRTMFATLLIPPPVPVTVNVNEPVVELTGSVIVSVEAKVGVAEGVLKTPLPPEGNPDTVNDTCELNPLRATTFTE